LRSIAGEQPIYSPLKGCLGRSRINAAVELSRSSLLVDPRSLDSNLDHIGCADGGAFDLSSGTKLHDQVATVTKKLGTTFLPNSPCSRWTEFLYQIFEGDREVIDFVQRAVGHTLSGSVLEQCFFILIGSGSNGKSTFSKTLHRLLGDCDENQLLGEIHVSA
jgi:putative DNA primase/helicase